jgi:hypothetical protein
MSHYLFLTTNNLATNPRLYKEINTALCNNNTATVVQFKLGNWSDTKSMILLEGLGEQQQKFNCITLDASSSYKVSWIKWGLLEKVSRKIYPLFKNNLKVNSIANTRRSWQILHALKNIKIKPDIICAHNLGTFYPTYIMGQKWKTPYVMDIEDYHPGEYIRFDAINEKKRTEFLMKKLLSKAYAITSASPLIGDHTLNLIGGHNKHQVILNSFPRTEFKEPENQHTEELTNKLKLVWFSQKISFGRGLEQLFEALLQLSKSSERQTYSKLVLTLIGDMDEEFNNKVVLPFKESLELSTKHTSLKIIPPLPQPQLHKELANHHIGLALEPGKDLNNELAISNKIIAYSLAGLYIIATQTKGQEFFMKSNTGFGITCEASASGISSGIQHAIQNSSSIISKMNIRFDQSKTLSWENESIKLQSIWDSLLHA